MGPRLVVFGDENQAPGLEKNNDDPNNISHEKKAHGWLGYIDDL